MAVVSVNKILNEADEFYSSVSRYLNVSLRGEVFIHFYSHIASYLGVKDDHVESSLRYLMGKTLTAELLMPLCIRLCANRELLRSQSVPPWRGQARDEWCYAVISAARQSFRGTGERGGLFKFIIVTGTAAGSTVTTWWSQRLCGVIQRRLGFPRRRGDRPNPIVYRHPRDFVRLRLCLKLVAGAAEAPTFRETKVTGSLLSHNRKLLQQRFRVSAKCPKGYADQFPCRFCPHGFAECPSATHRLGFLNRTCKQCNKPATFDPEFSDKVCLECLEGIHAENNQKKATV